MASIAPPGAPVRSAPSLIGHRLVGIHVELLERGCEDRGEGVEFGAEPEQRLDQLDRDRG
jgi:hypothetical protein